MKQNQTKSDRFTAEFNDFGSYLKYLRRRADLSQRDLGLAVGYGETQISRLEHNHRLPELSLIRAKFIPALGLDEEPEMAKRILELAQLAHTKEEVDEVFSEEMGVLEAIPVISGREVPRVKELNTLKVYFEEHNALLLYGFPGIGKSVLAASFIRTVFGSQPVFWHTVDGSDTSPFGTLIRQLALFLVSHGQMDAALFTQPLGVSPETALPTLTEQLRSLKPFICIDELHHLKNLSPLENIVETSGCKFLLVSREEIQLRDVKSMYVAGMNEIESQSLLQSMRISLTTDAAKTLVTLTQGNPMLLSLAGAKILENPSLTDKFIKQLATQKEITAFLMENTLEGLPDDAVNLLFLISIFRQPLNLYDASLAERLHSQNLVRDLNAEITTLQKRRFLENPSEARLHPLLQEHLGLAMRTRAELFYQLHLFAAQYFDATAHNALEALYHFTQSNEVNETHRFLQDQFPSLDSTGQGETAADLVLSLLNRTRNTSRLSEELEAQFLSLRGQLLMSGSRAGEAEADFRQALALAIRANLTRDIYGSVILKLARFLLQRGKVPEADRLCHEADKIFASDSNLGFRAEIQAVRCIVCLMQSKFADSAELANEALKLAEPYAHRDIRLVSAVRTMSYNTLGILSHIQRDISSALTHWRNAEEAALLVGNLRTAFRIKGNIGGLLFDQGELDESRQTYEGILDAVQAIGDVFTLGKILNALGAIYHLQARPVEALEILERARQLKRLIGDLQGEATTDNQRAQVLLASGRGSEALPIMERLLKQTEETGEMRWRASYLDTMGMMQLALGEFESARERLEEATSLSGVVSDPQLKTYLRNHLTLAYIGLENLSKAQETFETTEGIMSNGMVAVESNLVEAFLFAASGNMDEAQNRLSAMKKSADQLSMHLYGQIAIFVKDKIQSSLPIPQCVTLSMGAQGFPD